MMQNSHLELVAILTVNYIIQKYIVFDLKTKEYNLINNSFGCQVIRKPEFINFDETTTDCKFNIISNHQQLLNYRLNFDIVTKEFEMIISKIKPEKVQTIYGALK